jgi:preprotein translocase subunit SecE
MASNDDELPSDDDLESGSTKTAPKREVEAGSSRGGIRQFLREVRSELRKVAWPTRAETRNYSVIVLISLVFMTTLIFLVDLLFSDLVLRLFNAK